MFRASRCCCKVVSTPSTFSTTRYLSASKGEDEWHLGKQLSRASEGVTSNKNKWAEIVKTFPVTKWNKIHPTGLDKLTGAAYELKGLAKIHERSYDAKVLVEIRDVRVPAASHHLSFTRLARHRTHLIAYTHADLIDEETRDRVERWTNKIWPESRIIFVDTRVDGRNDTLHHFDDMLDGLLSCIERSSQNFALMVGVPNVGKSSVLMALLRLARQRGIIPKKIFKTRASPKKSNTKKGQRPGVEDVPGKTREITEYLLRDKPRAFFMDVPGITPPPDFFKERSDAWFGFGATNLLPLKEDALEDIELQKQFCSYILHCANRDSVFHYVDKLKLSEPTNDIDECLSRLSNKYKGKLDEDMLTLKRCQTFLKLYNTGNLGPLILDDMSNFEWRPYVRGTRQHDAGDSGSPYRRSKRKDDFANEDDSFYFDRYGSDENFDPRYSRRENSKRTFRHSTDNTLKKHSRGRGRRLH